MTLVTDFEQIRSVLEVFWQAMVDEWKQVDHYVTCQVPSYVFRYLVHAVARCAWYYRSFICRPVTSSCITYKYKWNFSLRSLVEFSSLGGIVDFA